GQRRMAAGEDQAQPVVAHGPLLGGFVTGVQQGGLGVLAVTGGLAAQAVDRPVAGRGDDPPGGGRRRPVLRPAPHGDGERVLDGLLGQVDVAEHAGEHGHGPAVLLGEDTCDVRHRSGRTSIGSPTISASLRPQPSASSRSAARMTVKPPRCSLPSAYGPSVISTSPSLARSTVAVPGACRAAANTHVPEARISSLSASSLSMIGSRTSGGGGSPSGW